MKINRRDYLKGMGAAGMLAGVTGLEGNAHVHGHTQEICPTEAMCDDRPRVPRVWTPGWCRDFPANPKYVKLIFYGLLGIAPRQPLGEPAKCQVGFHSKGDGPLHHELSIRAYSNVVDASSCTSSRKFEQKKKIESIVLTVADPDPDVDQAYFYQRGKACARRELTDPKDFRWIVDFESHYLYRKHLPATLEKKEDVYSPVLTVEKGIFYTLHKTGSTFLARSDDCKYFSDLGNVADYIAANIYVKSGGVTVNVDGAEFTVQAPGEIYFDNHCMNEDNDEMKCKFDPESSDKKKRSDFFMNYKAFDRKGHPEYHLHVLHYQRPEMLDVICERSNYEKMSDDLKKLNDESPCSAAGYGGENKGFPPY